MLLPQELIEKICLSANTPENSFILCVALRYRHLYKYVVPYMEYADIFNLSKKGCLDGLIWWKQSGLPLQYKTHAIDYASQNGHVHVLQWWKDSGLELKYTIYAMDWATAQNQIHILQWWVDSDLKLKFSTDSFMYANYHARCGNSQVIEWWNKFSATYPNILPQTMTSV
jgi:hypothetical protein